MKPDHSLNFLEYQRHATFRAMALNAAEQTGLPLVFGRTD